MKNKSRQEIAELETIAQTHCSRANRLTEEISLLTSKNDELKRQQQSHEDLSEREARLEKALRELKTDVVTVSI